jgi:hypothetical protein
VPRHESNGQCGCHCGGPGSASPRSREEIVGEMEEYKANLESEITALEKRINAVKAKAE